MLRIVRTETPPNAGPPTAGQPVEPRPDQLTPQNALAEPRDSLGERVRWRVRLVSCSIIPVSDPADRKALGKDQYFQIDGFVELGNQRILYAMPGSDLAENGDTEFVEFEGEFPITIVLSGGSDLVEAQRGTEGELSWDLGGYAWLEGRFYRLWSYHSEMLEQTQAAARQAAPLVVATKLTQATAPIRVTSAPIGWFGYGLAGATLCFLGILLYFVFSPDASRRHRISPRKT